MRQEAKLIPTARAPRGHRYCGVSATPGGRSFSPTWFSYCLRTIQMVGVFGAGKAVCFSPPEWDQRLEILDCFGQSRLGLETAFGLVLIVCWR